MFSSTSGSCEGGATLIQEEKLFQIRGIATKNAHNHAHTHMPYHLIGLDP